MRVRLIGAIALVVIAALVVWLVVGRSPKASSPVAKGSPVVARGHLLRSGVASIGGTVRDQAGAPIATATVCADAGVDASACVRTSALGTYTIAGLPPRSYEITAAAPNYQPARYHSGSDSFVTRVAVAERERRTGIDLVLESGAVALTGTVVDVSGGPIGHARVRAHIVENEYWRDRDHWYPPVEADANGAFTMWLRPGRAILEVNADGYAPADARADAPGTVTVLMTPESSISGTVVDAKGAPVADADVTAVYISTRVTTRSDDKGAFRVPSLVPGRYELRAEAANAYGELPGSVLVGLAQHVTGIVVRVDPAARVTGRVVTDDGKDCPGATVFLHRPQTLDDIAMVRGGDGVFVANAVAAGTVVPHPHCPGFFADERYPALAISTADHTKLEWKVHAGATIRGHVRDSKGAPIVDASIELEGTINDTFSLADGTYRLEGIAPGTYKLVAKTEHAGKATQELVVTGAQTIERDLTIDQGGTIRGTVKDTNGRPVVGQSIQASIEDEGDPKAGTTGPDGAFEMQVRPGEYTVYPARDFEAALADKQPITVAAGQVVTLTFTVPPQTGVIRGDVKDAAGKPVGDAYVSVHRQSGFSDDFMWSFSDRPVLTAADGTFEANGLGPGVYTAIARRRGGGEVRLKGIEPDADVHLVLPISGSIAGTLAFPDGTHPALVELTLRDKPHEYFRRERFYHSGGTFEITDVPPGELSIAAMAPDGFGAATFTLGPGENKTGATIALEKFVTVTGRVIDAMTKQPLAGYYVIPKVMRASLYTHADPDDVEHQTDATGRFRVATATGRVSFEIMSREMWDYLQCRLSAKRDIAGSTDLGDIPMLQPRRPKDSPKSTLGLKLDKLVVESASGAAAAAGIKKGDVVTAIDGIGGELLAECRNALLDVPIGATVKITLATGKTIDVVAADPKAPAPTIEFD